MQGFWKLGSLQYQFFKELWKYHRNSLFFNLALFEHLGPTGGSQTYNKVVHKSEMLSKKIREHLIPGDREVRLFSL